MQRKMATKRVLHLILPLFVGDEAITIASFKSLDDMDYAKAKLCAQEDAYQQKMP
jgi:hypothetical protein